MSNDMLTLPTIGSRIKEKRVESGISIRELAKRSSLTASFISQVENGKTNVSLESLRRISDALDVQMLHFLSESEPVSKEIVEEKAKDIPDNKGELQKLFDRTSPLITKDLRAKLYFPDSGVTYELLTNRLEHKMEAFIGQIAPASGNIAGRLNIATEEFIYCISGALKVGIRDQYYILHPGDSIIFEGDNLTCIASATETETTSWLSVMTPSAF